MRKIGTIIGIVVIILGVAGFNQWYRLYRHSEFHSQMAQNVRQEIINRGVRPVSWEFMEQTSGGFESVPTYPPEVKELEGSQITIVGYGMPIGAIHIEHGHHHGHSHASMLPFPVPILDLLLGHVHTRRFQGVTEFMLTPLPLDCYWREIAPINQVIYVRTANPIEFGDGVAIAVRGILELREQEGPKFFYVLKDAELVS